MATSAVVSKRGYSTDREEYAIAVKLRRLAKWLGKTPQPKGKVSIALLSLYIQWIKEGVARKISEGREYDLLSQCIGDLREDRRKSIGHISSLHEMLKIHGPLPEWWGSREEIKTDLADTQKHVSEMTIEIKKIKTMRALIPRPRPDKDFNELLAISADLTKKIQATLAMMQVLNGSTKHKGAR